MNNDEMKETLLENGFTPKDIAHMQNLISRRVKESDTERSLFSLVHTLKNRFYNVFSIFLLIIGIFIINIYFKYPMSPASFISNVIVTLVGLFCTYHIGALSLSYKSYRYCKKKEG